MWPFNLFFNIAPLWARRMEKKMSNLSDAVAALTAEVKSAEARVVAYQDQLKATIDQLNATITALQQPTPDVLKAIADLTALAAEVKTVDAAPDATPEA